MSSLQDQLQAALGASYRLEREIGAGGMATVFAGVETSLGRRVAIKVLQPELVAELSIDRFAREVRLAAQLQQANIVPLLSAGEAGGFSYYTMPLVEGSSLRARVATGVPIPLPEAVSILKDVARALAYAHHAGVVHRDIKPDNVLISGGTAVVSDFGIAKAMDAARTSNVAGGMTITSPGSSLGTPGYMAPEQVAGDNMDHRADIYAWGVLAWELLATRHPFSTRTTRQAMLAAHLTEPAPAILEHARSVPPALAALVMACLNKDPDRRPQSAGELLAVLDGVATPVAVFRSPARPWRRMALAAALVAGVVLAVWLPSRIRAKSGSAPVDGRPSVAVIPFENIGGDTAQEYFADGLTDELATALGRIPGLRVAARSASYRYKDVRDIDVRAVGAELGVRYLLLGSVRRSGQQLRLSAQLTGTDDALEIWSDLYVRPADDVLAVQDSLTTAITAALAARLGTSSTTNSAATMAARRGTSSHEAYDLYLKGHYYLNRRRPGLEGASRSFEAAIAQDPRFARAYAGLANSLALLRYFGETAQDVQPVIDHARRALSIDSTLADAHVALGILYMTIGRLGAAEGELRTAIRIEPENSAAHFQLGRCLSYLGRVDDAIGAFERAKTLEPYQATTGTWLGYLLTYRPDSQRAHTEAMNAWDLDSSSAVVQMFASMTALEAGRPAEALRIVRSSLVRNPLTRGTAPYVLGRALNPDSARAAIVEIQGRGASLWNDYVNLAIAALALPDTALALDALEKAAARDEPIFAYFPLSSVIFDPIRDTPRFAALMRLVDVPNYRPIRR